MSDVTHILAQIESGDPAAAQQLLPLVYDELRKLAAAKLAHEKPGQTLQATALVHEAYLRLVGPGVGSRDSGVGDRRDEVRSSSSDSRLPISDSPAFSSRGHFFAAAAEAMRRILIEQARRRASQKAGGHFQRQELDETEIAAPSRGVDLLVLNEALDRLAAVDPRKAELVKLRYFAGLTLKEAATALDIAESTADADWAYAKSWLRLEIGG